MTTVKLLNVPFESNYKDTVYFASKQEQESYMNLKVVKTFTDVTYQRKDNKIRVPAHIDTLYNCNYVAYTNTPYTNKTMYAFITDMEYKQDDCTWITIQTDVLQTWMFDYTVKQSFVEREHVVDDTIGANTIPENLETGEYIVNWSDEIKPFKSVRIVVGVTRELYSDAEGKRYTGAYSGINYRAFPHTTTGIANLNALIEMFEKEGIVDAIKVMFLAPSELVKIDGEDLNPNANSVLASETPYNALFTYDKQKFKEYTPKNNKLYCYPYNYLLISNNNGASAIYQFEHFMNEEIALTVYGVLTPGCSIRMIPMNYKGTLLNDEEGLNLGKYPICNWTSDEYINWLTQNGVNIGVNLVAGLGQIIAGAVGGVATGGIGGVIGGASAMGGVSAVASQLAQIHQMSFTPPQANGNINSGDVITATNKNTFTLYQMCCKPEYMRCIDEYFQMFGYKVNRVKVPEKNHRPYFWYTKTIDVNIDGAIPNKDLQEIKNCYNNGITFWKPSATMGVYTVNNSPN